jgi:hypothetical protein
MPKRSRQRSRQRSHRGGGAEEGGMPKGVTAPPMPPQDSAMSGSSMPASPSVASPSVQAGGKNESLGSSPYAAGEGGFIKSQYYTISGGSRKRKHGKKYGSKRRHRKQKGGNPVLATAAVPFGLLALQRYFKGSRKTKKSVANMGRSFKRTFRRRY